MLILHHTEPCRATLSCGRACALLFCAFPCSCHATPRHTVLSCALPCPTMLCHLMLCHAVLSCAMVHHTKPCQETLWQVVPSHDRTTVCQAVVCCAVLSHPIPPYCAEDVPAHVTTVLAVPFHAHWPRLCLWKPPSPQEHGLDFQRLLDASTYKEMFRQDMIRWGEEKRRADPGFFCRAAVEGALQPVWVSFGECTGALRAEDSC